MFLWELCWHYCLCWLCWHCRQRKIHFETTEAAVMLVLKYVAKCWCCVDGVACVDCVDAADKERQVLRQMKLQWWQCCCMLLHVDAVLTSVDSVDMNWKNSHVFLRAVLTVLLVLTVLTHLTKRDRFWDRSWATDASASTFCYMMLHVD